MKTKSIFKGIADLFSAAVLASSLTGCASNSESKAPSSDAESKTQSSKAESQPTSSETETVTIYFCYCKTDLIKSSRELQGNGG